MRTKILFAILIIEGCIVGGVLMHQKMTKMRESASQKQAWIRGKMKLQEVKIILYEKGKQKNLDCQSPYFLDVLYECERLLETAADSLLLAVDEELIEKIKMKQVALEIIYPEAVNIPVWGVTYHITRFLIPFKGEYSEGIIFFLIKDKNSLYYGNATNSQGIGKLKKILKRWG